MIVASGDNGNSAVGSECDFVPDVVGSSEWVTSVGATMPSLDSKPYCSAAAFEQLGTCEELGQVRPVVHVVTYVDILVDILVDYN